MVGHTQKVDYEAAEEAETAGSLLSGTWPEVMLCGSSRCQGASWTLQICVRGTNQKKAKTRGWGGGQKNPNKSFGQRFAVTFLLFLDYSKLEDCLVYAGGIFRKKMKD